MSFESVQDYLESQRRGRPQTLKEISLSVQKSEFATIRELNGLILRGIVRSHAVRFNNREVHFYTVRDDVTVSVASSRHRPGAWEI